MNHTLTVAFARKAKVPNSGDYIVRDIKTQGLGLRVYSSGQKRWIFQKKFAGRPLRICLGPFQSLPLESKFDPKLNRSIKGARQLAEEYSALIRQGIDPRLEIKKRIDEATKEKLINDLTVEVAWQQYMSFKNQLKGKHAPKERTIQDWQKIETKLSAGLIWKVQLVKLTGEKLAQELNRLCSQSKNKSATNSGMTQASLVLRNLRAAYNHALEQYKLDIDEHAFKSLSKKIPAWDKTNARTRRLGEADGSFHKWWAAVDELSHSHNRDSRAIGDWLKLCVLWGGRRTELLSLKWEQVKLEEGIVSIPGTATKNKRDHLIPITKYVRQLLEKRAEDVQNGFISDNDPQVVEWVFPSSRTGPNTAKRSHIKSPGKAIRRIVEKSGIPFSPHDLRRTFASLLSETGATDMAVKRALNHAPDSTAAKFYVNNPRIKNLRAVYQALEDTILIEAGVKSNSDQTITMSEEEFELYKAFKKQQGATSKQEFIN